MDDLRESLQLFIELNVSCNQRVWKGVWMAELYLPSSQSFVTFRSLTFQNGMNSFCDWKWNVFRLNSQQGSKKTFKLTSLRKEKKNLIASLKINLCLHLCPFKINQIYFNRFVLLCPAVHVFINGRGNHIFALCLAILCLICSDSCM